VLSTRQQVGVAHALRVARAALKHNQTLPSRAAFDAPHRPRHSGETRVPRRPMEELWPRVFPSFPLFPLRKSCCPLQKKKEKKKEGLDICLLS